MARGQLEDLRFKHSCVWIDFRTLRWAGLASAFSILVWTQPWRIPGPDGHMVSLET